VPGNTQFIVLLPLEMPPVVDVALPEDGEAAEADAVPQDA